MTITINNTKLYPIGRWESVEHKLENAIVRLDNKIYEMYMDVNSQTKEIEKLEKEMERLENAVDKVFVSNGMAFGTYDVYRLCKNYVEAYRVRNGIGW